MSSPTCAVRVFFHVHPEHFESFREAVLLQAHNSLTREPWCKQFDVATCPDHPNTFLLYETYDDRAAFDKHRASDHLAEFNQTIEGWVESKRVDVWDILPAHTP